MKEIWLALAVATIAGCSTAEDLTPDEPTMHDPADPSPPPPSPPPPGDEADPPVPEPPDPEPADPDPPPPTADPSWTPRPFTADRFVIFYQMTADVLATYADPDTGLPVAAGHQYVFTVSHATANASKTLADSIHAAGPDFLYAPAFDLNSRPGWATTASDEQLRVWAHEFRDEALAKHADLFAFNEAPTSTSESPEARVAMAKLLRFLNQPDAGGRRLRGVFFLTHRPSMPENWTVPASAFWQAIDETCDAVVAEHYHSHGFVCGTSEAALAAHYFGMREWLNDSGEPAKISIANRKFTVLHSSRYAPGSSGWQGADADSVTLSAFQRNLSKAAKVTRATPGGTNRISFAPIASNITLPGVHPRIALLARWHYGRVTAAPVETACVADAAVNCQCD